MKKKKTCIIIVPVARLLLYVCLASLSLSGRCNVCRVQKPVRFMEHTSVGNVVSMGTFC